MKNITPKFNQAICFDWDGTIIDSMNDKFENFIDAVLKAFEIDKKVDFKHLALYRRMIDFCHKEYGGELRVYQFDNVIHSLSHPEDLLRLLTHLSESPDSLKQSSYLRETHLHKNFEEELNGDHRDAFLKWIQELVVELSAFLSDENDPFPEFRSIPDKNARFEIFNQKYTDLNTERSKNWKTFPDTVSVIIKLAEKYDLYIGSSLLNPLLNVEVANYPEIDKNMMEIYGGDKSEALKKVKSFGYKKIVFVGDMPADRVVAEKNSVPFYRIHPEEGQGNKDWIAMIENVEDMLKEH